VNHEIILPKKEIVRTGNCSVVQTCDTVNVFLRCSANILLHAWFQSVHTPLDGHLQTVAISN